MYHTTEPHPSAAAFRTGRDLLLRHRDDYETARRELSGSTANRRPVKRSLIAYEH